MPRNPEDAPLSDEQAADLLADVELRCRSDVSEARRIVAYRTKVAVSIRPGNIAERADRYLAGNTTEIRRHGMVCLTSQPVMVGNVFNVTFERSALAPSSTLAMCDRCTMLGDTSFELRFQFVAAIDVPNLQSDDRE
jgi:hypothetical protein